MKFEVRTNRTSLSDGPPGPAQGRLCKTNPVPRGGGWDGAWAWDVGQSCETKPNLGALGYLGAGARGKPIAQNKANFRRASPLREPVAPNKANSAAAAGWASGWWERIYGELNMQETSAKQSQSARAIAPNKANRWRPVVQTKPIPAWTVVGQGPKDAAGGDKCAKQSQSAAVHGTGRADSRMDRSGLGPQRRPSAGTSVRNKANWPKRGTETMSTPGRCKGSGTDNCERSAAIRRMAAAAATRCATKFRGVCAPPPVILSGGEGSGPSTITYVGCIRGPDASLRSA
jgi:hypothetical protein